MWVQGWGPGARRVVGALWLKKPTRELRTRSLLPFPNAPPHPSQAYYVSGDGTASLFFEYVVSGGDLSFGLDYVDAMSLEPGIDPAHEPGRIYQGTRLSRPGSTKLA